MIAVLAPHVIDQIAAGEVIERPASVVKELVDNAIDAAATTIAIDVSAGGRALVRVADNGIGMSAKDAVLALERHATSKLRELDDLWGIASMGFRGEALPSIASVSRMTLTTRRAGDDAATRVVIEAGRLVSVTEAGAPVGTTVEVSDLLFNLPARLKFLKGEATEASHVTELVAKVAMAYPRLHLKLKHNGRTALDVPPDRDGLARAQALLGPRIASRLIAVSGEESGVRVTGYLGAPELAQATARGVQLFVGHRPVRDRNLLHALAMGYGELVPRGRYPLAIVLVDVPAGTVDVNVHPQKLEVRFSDAPSVAAAVRHVVQAGIHATRWRDEAGGAGPVQMIASVAPPVLPFDGHATQLAERHVAQMRSRQVPLGFAVPEVAAAEEVAAAPGLPRRFAAADVAAAPGLPRRFAATDVAAAPGLPRRFAAAADVAAAPGLPRRLAADDEVAAAPTEPQSVAVDVATAPAALRSVAGAEVAAVPAMTRSSTITSGGSSAGAASPVASGAARDWARALRDQTRASRLAEPREHWGAGEADRQEPQALDTGAGARRSSDRAPTGTDDAELDGLSAPGAAADGPDPRDRDAVAAGSLALYRARAAQLPGAVPVAAPGFFSQLRYLGQLDLTYLVCEASGELVLVDQHAAHERVELARLRRRQHRARDLGDAGDTGDAHLAVQKLLFPITFEATPPQLELVSRVGAVLSEVGFEVEPFGKATLAVKSVPANLRHGDPAELVQVLLRRWVEAGAPSDAERLDERTGGDPGGLAGGSSHREERALRGIDALLGEIACHSVVRAGDRLTTGEAETLLRSLDGVDLSLPAPHGRAVLLRLPLAEIGRRFSR